MSAHVMVRLALFIFTVFYCNGWRTDRFDNLTAKAANSSGSMNDSKWPAAVSLNALSVFDNALTMF